MSTTTKNKKTNMREEARQHARKLAPVPDHVRDIELETWQEMNPAMHKLILQELKKVEKAVEPVDPDKLPPQLLQDIQQIAHSMDSQIKDIVRIKLKDLDSLEEAVQAVLAAGPVSLVQAVIHHLAGDRAQEIAKAMLRLFKHGKKVQEELEVAKEGSKEHRAHTATLKRIDKLIHGVFHKRNYKELITAADELRQAQREECQAQRARKRQKLIEDVASEVRGRDGCR